MQKITYEAVEQLFKNGEFKLEGFECTTGNDGCNVDFKKDGRMMCWVDKHDSFIVMNGRELEAAEVKEYLIAVLGTKEPESYLKNIHLEAAQIEALEKELEAALNTIKTLRSELGEANNGWTEADGKVSVYERILPGGFTNLSK